MDPRQKYFVAKCLKGTFLIMCLAKNKLLMVCTTYLPTYILYYLVLIRRAYSNLLFLFMYLSLFQSCYVSCVFDRIFVKSFPV